MVSAIIVAAGKGIRMQSPIKKQYLILSDRPIIAHTLLTFDGCEAVHAIFLVVPEEDIQYFQKTIIPPLLLTKPVQLVPGGAIRQESVYNGLLSVENDAIVLIHDGVRPFVHPKMIEVCIREAMTSGACIPGLPIPDTIKRVRCETKKQLIPKTHKKMHIIETLSRDDLWIAQTPQAFQYQLIREAHEKAKQEGYIGTDDASLVERMGKPVTIIMGSRSNIKITTPEDIFLAELLYREKQCTNKT